LFDLFLATLAIPVAVPLIGACALVSAVRFRSNPFFVQERVGRNNETFQVTKIRSLPTSFPRVGRHQFDHDAVCRWGKFLRDTHIDELPQLFNVLNGSMSMVGPRPMISEVLEEIPSADRQNRSLVRPGLTGVWQVSTAGGGPLQDCPELDSAYVENGSFRTDVQVLVKTVAHFMGDETPDPAAVLVQLGWQLPPRLQFAV
jgi:lipopolysaccharide/colanic/teichoic acid biosynthesis glycosyltransferase